MILVHHKGESQCTWQFASSFSLQHRCAIRGGHHATQLMFQYTQPIQERWFRPFLSQHGPHPIGSRYNLTVTSSSSTLGHTPLPRVRSRPFVEPHAPWTASNTCFASRHVETSNFAQRDYDKPNTLNGHSVCQKGRRHVIAVEQSGQRLLGLSRNHSGR
jgi:hypothetical protein